MKVIERPGFIGVFGGGQLARKTTLAAHALGYGVRILDPDPHCAAAGVCDELITASFDDPAAATQLAERCEVVTVDREDIGQDALLAAQKTCRVSPSPDILAMVQDRQTQREWLRKSEFPIPAVRFVDSVSALDDAVAELGRPCFVKASRGGYDGRGQVRVASDEDLAEAHQLVSQCRCVVEARVPYVAELSIQVARSATGESKAFAPAYNHHESQILAWTMLPAPVPASVAAAAVTLGTKMVEALDLIGLLTVELYLLPDQSLVVNELAPRPHNSYHSTLRNVRSSQFDQLVRAVLGLPLGDTRIAPYIVVANLLGELWLADGGFQTATALRVNGVDVDIYGKRVAHRGRKMGHLTATGTTPRAAFDAAAEAMEALGAPLPEPALDLQTLSVE